MELDGETMNVDLRGKVKDGEEEICSSGSGDLVLAKGETSGEYETEEWEDLGILVWESADEEEDKRVDPWSGVDFWTFGEQVGFCDVEVGVLIDVFGVLGVGQVDGLLLEGNAVQNIRQTTIRILDAFAGMWLHNLFI